MVQERGRLKILRCLSLLFVIAFGLLTVVTTGCGGGDDSSVTSNGSDTDQNFLEVLINQIDTTECPTTNTIKAYVSVTDQDGNVIPDLPKEAFSVFEDEDEQFDFDVVYPASLHSPISVCLAMDYSGSMDDIEDVPAMEEAAIAFVDKMGVNDEGEIIKFSSKVEAVQPFTADKEALRNMISNPWPDAGYDTALYDAIYQGIQDAKGRADRRAVIAITDGVENCSVVDDKDDVIQLALESNVPVFAIRIGYVPLAEREKIAMLREIAEETGGKYFFAPGPEDLEEIYLQLSEMIVLKQYIVSYVSGLDDGETHELQIIVETKGLSGTDVREFTACSP
jgi:VWFA-related protein